MKLTKNGADHSKSVIRVRVLAIKEDLIECEHVASKFKIKSLYKKEMSLEVGQIVLVEYIAKENCSGYIVVDDLTEEVTAKVLEAHHIISNGIMYTSLILENTENHKRIHSLIPSMDRLFCSSNIIITGDEVVVKINNGQVFSIKQRDAT